ncbi:hypothetical protein HOY82DRAFT_639467 [Tuber indicum]|nr:hypothetical protein HOY82DRAFT_639467 [Tuber indicum]
MKRGAQDALKQTLETEELEVREVIGERFVGNLQGLGLAGLPARVRLLEEQNILQKNKMAAHEAQIAELTHYVFILREAGPEYKSVRNRYLSVFKRDILKEILKPWDRTIIEAGNVTAHSGDAVIDALLYDGIEGRPDTYVFEALYGLHPFDVKRITRNETIKILNLHAEVKTHRDKTGTNEFYEKFAVFIEAYKRSDPGVDYVKEGHTNETCAAYWSLLNCQKYVDGN